MTTEKTCEAMTGDTWFRHKCGRAAKDSGGIGEKIPMCPIHLAAYKRQLKNREKWHNETLEQERRGKVAKKLASRINRLNPTLQATPFYIMRHHELGYYSTEEVTINAEALLKLLLPK